MNRFPDPTPRFADSELDELLGAYALHAVDDDERAAVDEYLNRSPRAMAEVNELREAAAWLGNSTGELPRDLWSQIALRLDTPPPIAAMHTGLPDTAPTVSNTGSYSSSPDELVLRRRVRVPRWLAPALSAAAVVAVVALGAQVLRQSRRLDQQSGRLSAQSAELTAAKERAAAVVAQTNVIRTNLDERNRQLALQLAEAARSGESYDLQLARLRTAPATHTSVLVADGAPIAEAYLGEGGEGFLVGLHLPALDNNHTYQLWGVKGDTILSLGVLGRQPNTVPIAASGSWTKLVLTVETSPGVAVSSQAPLAVGDVT